MTSYQIYCPIRKQNIQDQPEERVRQKLIHWLNQVHQIPLESMMVEANLRQFGSTQDWRIDLLVMKKNQGQSMPWLLCECKAPGKMAMGPWMDQAQRYLQILAPEFVLGTDGQSLWLYQKEEANYRVCKQLPKWK